MPHPVSVALPGDVEPLPDGWCAVSSWSNGHGIHPRSVDRHIDDGRMPAPHLGHWQRGQQTILRAYDREQHAAACVYARAHWPGRYLASCGPDCPGADVTF